MSLPFPIVERKACGLNSDFFFAIEVRFATEPFPETCSCYRRLVCGNGIPVC
jgi:hypothetical protein